MNVKDIIEWIDTEQEKVQMICKHTERMKLFDRKGREQGEICKCGLMFSSECNNSGGIVDV